MCFSVQVSLAAWITSVVIGMYLWHRNRRYDRWNAAFIWTFSLVQLWEAGIWSGIGNQETFVKLILLTLYAQPLVQTYAGYKYTNSNILRYLSWLYLGLLGFALYRTFTENFYVSKDFNGHLLWKTDRGSFMGPLGIVYLVGLFIGLAYVWKSSWPLILIGIVTLVWSVYSTINTRNFGSLWCFTAVGYSIAALFV